MPAAMPCETPVNCRGETCRSIGKTRPIMLVLSKLTSPREFDWKELLVGIMKIILQQRNKCIKPLLLGAQVYPMPQAMKIPAAKAAMDKERKKLEKIGRGT